MRQKGSAPTIPPSRITRSSASSVSGSGASSSAASNSPAISTIAIPQKCPTPDSLPSPSSSTLPCSLKPASPMTTIFSDIHHTPSSSAPSSPKQGLPSTQSLNNQEATESMEEDSAAPSPHAPSNFSTISLSPHIQTLPLPLPLPLPPPLPSPQQPLNQNHYQQLLLHHQQQLQLHQQQQQEQELKQEQEQQEQQEQQQHRPQQPPTSYIAHALNIGGSRVQQHNNSTLMSGHTLDDYNQSLANQETYEEHQTVTSNASSFTYPPCLITSSPSTSLQDYSSQQVDLNSQNPSMSPFISSCSAPTLLYGGPPSFVESAMKALDGEDQSDASTETITSLNMEDFLFSQQDQQQAPDSKEQEQPTSDPETMDTSPQQATPSSPGFPWTECSVSTSEQFQLPFEFAQTTHMPERVRVPVPQSQGYLTAPFNPAAARYDSILGHGGQANNNWASTFPQSQSTSLSDGLTSFGGNLNAVDLKPEAPSHYYLTSTPSVPDTASNLYPHRPAQPVSIKPARQSTLVTPLPLQPANPVVNSSYNTQIPLAYSYQQIPYHPPSAAQLFTPHNLSNFPPSVTHLPTGMVPAAGMHIRDGHRVVAPKRRRIELAMPCRSVACADTSPTMGMLTAANALAQRELLPTMLPRGRPSAVTPTRNRRVRVPIAGAGSLIMPANSSSIDGEATGFVRNVVSRQGQWQSQSVANGFIPTLNQSYQPGYVLGPAYPQYTSPASNTPFTPSGSTPASATSPLSQSTLHPPSPSWSTTPTPPSAASTLYYDAVSPAASPPQANQVPSVIPTARYLQLYQHAQELRARMQDSISEHARKDARIRALEELLKEGMRREFEGRVEEAREKVFAECISRKEENNSMKMDRGAMEPELPARVQDEECCESKEPDQEQQGQVKEEPSSCGGEQVLQKIVRVKTLTATADGENKATAVAAATTGTGRTGTVDGQSLVGRVKKEGGGAAEKSSNRKRSDQARDDRRRKKKDSS